MPMRFFLLLLLYTSILLPLSLCHAEEKPQTQPLASEIENERTQLSYGNYSISADLVFGSFEGAQTAEGNVVMLLPLPQLIGRPLQVTINADSVTREKAPPAVKGKPATGGDILTIRNAILTTCVKQLNHRHYELRAKTIVITPDMLFEARSVSLYFGHVHLLTLSKLSGRLSSVKPSVPFPTFTVGSDSVDGVYVSAAEDIALSENNQLHVKTSIGTGKLFRGLLEARHSFSSSPKISGTVSVLASYHEKVANRPSDFSGLAISRFPAFQGKLNEIPLSIGPLKDFRFNAGAGVGRYNETPTDVTRTRSQIWGVLNSPRYKAAGLDFYGGVGMQYAYNGSQQHRITIGQLSLETPEKADPYFDISLIRRFEDGSTPFLFDHVDIHKELFTETEFALGKKSPWRLLASNRFDLDESRSRSTPVTLLYSNDCFSYGLTYDVAKKSFGVGLLFVGVGTFRHQGGSIGFTQ